MTRLAGLGVTGDRVLVCGHKGAAALAPENSLAGIEAALVAGVDIVEIDVVRDPAGRLRLAHSLVELVPGAPELREALALLAVREAWLNLDLKDVGFEAEAVAAAADAGIDARTIVCSVHPGSLLAVRAAGTRVATGLSYPWDRRGVAERPLLAPAVRMGSAALRASLPWRIVRMIEAAAADAAMLHHSVVSTRVVRRLRAAGVPVFVWTVDDRALALALARAGVDGLISNDPRLLGNLPKGSGR